MDFQRLRREVAFDRFLVRLFAGAQAPWVLKGGYVLELRLEGARGTRDIDLAFSERIGTGADKEASLHSALRSAATRDLGDYFVFDVGPAMMDLAGPLYGGSRFPVEALVDNRTYVRFHIDVGIGDLMLAPLETVAGRDWLAFAGIPTPTFPTISAEQHFAEKVHAYTVPRVGTNTRVRDLVDMVLLIKEGALDGERTGKALRVTFERRKSHPLPAALEPPPESWKGPFAALAEECGLPKGMGEAFSVVSAYYGTLPISGS